MDLDEAVKAHSNWKMKLSSYLKSVDGSLRSAEVRADNRCALGQWLHGEGRSHAASPEYRALLEGETALRSDSEFGHASRDVVAAIMAMQRKVKG